MRNQPFQINGVGKISGDRIEFGSPAEQNPKQRKKNNGQQILLPNVFFVACIVIPDEKEQKYTGNNQHVQEYKCNFKISRISNFLHKTELYKK